MLTNRQNWMLDKFDLSGNNSTKLVFSAKDVLYKREVRLENGFEYFLWEKIN
tara:strand:- start:308 stop:463 length:156 start_codon:yes stop_codon:yes gene_type:complete